MSPLFHSSRRCRASSFGVDSWRSCQGKDRRSGSENLVEVVSPSLPQTSWNHARSHVSQTLLQECPDDVQFSRLSISGVKWVLDGDKFFRPRAVDKWGGRGACYQLRTRQGHPKTPGVQGIAKMNYCTSSTALQ